jgi:glucokinase
VSVVGVDLGGTKVAVAALSGRTLSDPITTPTERDQSSALVDQLVATVGKARGEDLEAVGIGVPSVVDFKSGRVVSSVNIPLADVNLREVLSERLGVPVFLDNDATVAALAEAHDENLRQVVDDLVMLTIGTGVGGGLVLGGRIYRGATGGAGEIGHTIVALDPGEVLAKTGERFPRHGSLEYVAAGHALDRLAGEAAKDEPDSELGKMAAESGKVLGADAVKAARDGDPVARRIVEHWGQRIGIGVANAINTFDPQEVVIGGGGARAGDLLLEPAKRVAASYVLPGLGRKCTIRLARHEMAGVLGAALLAEHELAAGKATPAEGRR